jgi:peptide/nickel transport system permease protein
VTASTVKLRNPSLVIGAVITGVMVIVALLSLVWTPYSPSAIATHVALQDPSASHLLGTDEYGRDVFSRLMAGTQITLYAGVVSVCLAAVAGIPAGLVAAMRGGIVAEIVLRVSDLIYGFPALLAAITLAAAFGASTTVAMIAIGIAYIPVFARLTRASALGVLSSGYVLAARAYGRQSMAIVRRHVLPNIASVLVVQASLLFSVAIVAESALDFLGLGTPPLTPSWGNMLADAQKYIFDNPLLVLWPGVAIFLAVLGFNMLGDGLRERFDR